MSLPRPEQMRLMHFCNEQFVFFLLGITSVNQSDLRSASDWHWNVSPAASAGVAGQWSDPEISSLDCDTLPAALTRSWPPRPLSLSSVWRDREGSVSVLSRVYVIRSAGARMSKQQGSTLSASSKPFHFSIFFFPFPMTQIKPCHHSLVTYSPLLPLTNYIIHTLEPGNMSILGILTGHRHSLIVY